MDMRWIIAAVLVCAASGGGALRRPGPATVPRCCAAGQELAPAAVREAALSLERAAAACQPGTAAWRPLVYAPAKGGYLERGHQPPHWRLAYAALPACPELRVLPEHAPSFALLANNASLLVRGGVVAPDLYCSDALGVLLCAAGAPATAVHKCCADGEAVLGGEQGGGVRCSAHEGAAGASGELHALAAAAGLGVALGWPVCRAGSRYAAAGALRGATLNASGTLLTADGELPGGAWCADAAAADGALRVWSCAEVGAAEPPLRHVLYGAGLAVGAAFLAATLAAGFALPAAHHALHWRCQTHYVAALLLGDVLLAATQLAGASVPPALCRALAVCMHFLFLSAFFWLNTMCFNIWWTFRDFRPTSLERGQEWWRLRVYMVYAWGGPLALAGAAAALDALPQARDLLRPRFGERRCWFFGDLEILVYFFGPVGVLLLVNLALFISTTRQLTCGLWRRDEVKSTSERAALGRVCAKLVVVMGVTWGADVLSWAVGGPHYVWYATDLLNALQGLLIFLVVGCQPHAWAALRGAARAVCCRAAPRRHTHSSTHLPSVGESLTHTTPAPATAPAPAAAPAPAPAKVPMETVC